VAPDAPVASGVPRTSGETIAVAHGNIRYSREGR
jgi:hypothetical protein